MRSGVRTPSGIVDIAYRTLLVFSVGTALLLTSNLAVSISPQGRQSQPRGVNQNKKAPDETKRGTAKTETRIDGPVTVNGTIETVNQPSAAEIERQRKEDSKPWYGKPECLNISPGWLAMLLGGHARLDFDTAVTYEDVFGKPHRVSAAGIFDLQAKSLQIEQRHEE